MQLTNTPYTRKMKAAILAALFMVSSIEAFSVRSPTIHSKTVHRLSSQSLNKQRTLGITNSRGNTSGSFDSSSSALFWFWPSSKTTTTDEATAVETDAKKSTKLSLSSGDVSEGLLSLPSPLSSLLDGTAFSSSTTTNPSKTTSTPPTTKSLEEIVDPVANALEESFGIGEWAFSYADLTPENETTPIGISFLATNVAYGIAGSYLLSQGNAVLGTLTEIACLASFCYHYAQLKYGQEGSSVVRLTLLVDYFFAISSIMVGSIQLAMSHQLPEDALVGGSLALASLAACWVWEEGMTYIFFHSLWHLFSAYTGFVIGSMSG